MAKLQLRYGPYTLDEKTIDAKVPKKKKGAYALGPLLKSKKGIRVLRVGRSDSNLNARLKQYLGDSDFDECTHFFFELFSTKKEAFNVECELYHDYDPELNYNHPGRPKGTDYCCPVDEDDECPPCSDED